MSQDETQLHHCEHCATVFEAPKNAGLKVACTQCGKFPVAQFVSRAKSKPQVSEDDVRGVAGKDVADFVAMQRVRRKKQAQMAVIFWIVLIVAAPIVFFSLNKSRHAESKALAAENKQAREFERKKAFDAIKEASGQFDRFLNAESANEASGFVVGGVRQILKIEESLANRATAHPEEGAVVDERSYIEGGEYPRVEVLLDNKNGVTFEVVSWLVDGEWRLDWEHYRRFNTYDFEQFLRIRKSDLSLPFKLYVRRRYSASKKDDQDLVLLFYKPTPQAGERLAESPEVIVTAEHPSYAALSEQFEKLADLEKGVERVVGSLDSEDLLRVKADLSFRQNAEGKLALHLDKVSAFHWMAFDPVKKAKTVEE